jgi:hypothetical protein
MVTPLERLQQVADEIRHLPSAFNGLPIIDTIEVCDARVSEAIDLGAFSGAEHDAFRAAVRLFKERGSGRWCGVYCEAAKYLAPSTYQSGQPEESAWPVCSPIADAIEREIRRLEIETAPDTPPHTSKTEKGEGNGGKYIEDKLRDLERTIPPLDTQSTKWVKNKRAAQIEGLETRTLSSYRNQGIQKADKTLGRDKDGRVWRRQGTPNSHPWYLRSTLLSQSTSNSKPLKKP